MRPWDGLVVLVRTPASPADAEKGKWVFRGYVHGEHWVGRWRETVSRPNVVGYEGAFVVRKAEGEEAW